MVIRLPHFGRAEYLPLFIPRCNLFARRLVAGADPLAGQAVAIAEWKEVQFGGLTDREENEALKGLYIAASIVRDALTIRWLRWAIIERPTFWPIAMANAQRPNEESSHMAVAIGIRMDR